VFLTVLMVSHVSGFEASKVADLRVNRGLARSC
jgi:hypothetical protein